MKILIALYHPFVLWNAPEWLLERLRAEFPEHEIQQVSRYENIEAGIRDAEALISWSIRPEQFTHAEKLHWIHSPAAAVHQLMFPELVASDVVVTNAREVHGPVVAEHALALVFALAKRLPLAMRLQQQQKWGQQAIWDEKPTTRELMGATVCLLGMGNIGGEFARRAKALGMRVIAIREHPEKGTGGADAVYGQSEDSIKAALGQADFLVLTAPLTTSTRRFVNTERIRHMKSDAYLVNVGRGPLIDDAALIDALRTRRIAGAALDVFEVEPLPPDSPYWKMDNVLITPHTAAVTEKLWERHFALICENLRRYARKQPLLGLVDKRKGY